MPIIKTPPPLTLYVHIPWCVRKCPYCDFNSHQLKSSLPEAQYIEAMMDDLESHLPEISNRDINAIFFGGGTPSLFSAVSIGKVLEQVNKKISFVKDIEITLEANPGTMDATNFAGYKLAGVNRLSVGVQSFQNDKLKILGRIHDQTAAEKAIKMAQDAGFDNINIDLMYGLPQQTIAEALDDIDHAVALQPTHLSWYQLTLEPNTLFYKQPPQLPADETIWEMQIAGQTKLAANQFEQYEVSAYAKHNLACRHNLNYWQFGDYLGIGAGAHSKITCTQTSQIKRFSKLKHPRDYLTSEVKTFGSQPQILNEKDKIFEFMLNALRLTNGVPYTLFCDRTGLEPDSIKDIFQKAKQRGLLFDDANHFYPTELGRRFLNDLISMFLEI